MNIFVIYKKTLKKMSFIIIYHFPQSLPTNRISVVLEERVMSMLQNYILPIGLCRAVVQRFSTVDKVFGVASYYHDWQQNAVPFALVEGQLQTACVR